MGQRKQIKGQKKEETPSSGYRKERTYRSDVQPKATDDELVMNAGLSPEGHAALLAGARSEEQRARLVTGLQQSHGNAYVQRLINSPAVQAKLTVSSPGDVYEKEADRVAETVQRQEEEEELQPKLAADVQRQVEDEEEEEEPVQTKAAGARLQTVSEGLETQIEGERGSGQPLDGKLKDSLEKRLGHDFSQVNVHADATADKLSRQLGAEAFTTGRDVFFREGNYQPGSRDGKGLIAHELTHVVQQQAAAPLVQRDVLEEQAPGLESVATAETASEQPVLTQAQRGLWNSLVVTPLQQSFDEMMNESPNWQTMADTLSGVHSSMENLVGALTLSSDLQSRIEALRGVVFDCYLMAHSHATGGEVMGMNLRRALDTANVIASPGGPPAATGVEPSSAIEQHPS